MIKSRNKAGNHWHDWKWQQQNSIRDVMDLKYHFSRIAPDFFEKLARKSKDRLKFQITPYMLGQIPTDLTQE